MLRIGLYRDGLVIGRRVLLGYIGNSDEAPAHPCRRFELPRRLGDGAACGRPVDVGVGWIPGGAWDQRPRTVHAALPVVRRCTMPAFGRGLRGGMRGHHADVGRDVPCAAEPAAEQHDLANPLCGPARPIATARSLATQALTP